MHPQTHPEGKPNWIPKEAKFIQGDVNNYDDLSNALQGVEYISHQAAFGGFTNALSYYFDSNVSGTAKIFEVIREEKLSIKVVLASYKLFLEECTNLKWKYFSRQPRPEEQLQKGLGGKVSETFQDSIPHLR